MSAYHRLISYIYAYEGGIKGKNTGFAKLETRGTSCRIQVSVRRVFAGGSPIGVYLLAGQEEIRIGTLFVRGGNGEFRAVVNCENIEGSGCNMEECCGLTLHETDSAWRAYTTIWEDAVAHAAEVELADVTAEKVREQEAEKEEATRKLAENVSGEVNSASVGKEKLDEASELTRSGEMESQDTSTETEKKEAVNINETDFGISQPQPEKLEDSNLEIFEDTESRYLRNIRSSRGRSCSGNANGNTARKFSGIHSRSANGDTEGKFSGILSGSTDRSTAERFSRIHPGGPERGASRFSTRPSRSISARLSKSKTTATRFFQGISQRRSRRDSLGPPARYLSESNRLRMRRRLRDSGNQTAGYRASAAGKLGVWK